MGVVLGLVGGPPREVVVEHARPRRGMDRRGVGHHTVEVEQHRVVLARIDGERQLHGPRSLLVLVDDGAAIEHLRCSSW
jgi:hypothetical protein